MIRAPKLDPATMSDDQKRLHAAILAGPRGVVRGPVQVWLHNPGLAEHAQALGAYCRFGTSLPARLSELAILITAAFWQAGYEWRSHAPMAHTGGLSEAVSEAIRIGAPPPFAAEDEAIVYRLATELLQDHMVTPVTWDDAQSVLGMAGVIDLIGVLGYYALISMTIKAFEIGSPSADDPTFQR